MDCGGQLRGFTGCISGLDPVQATALQSMMAASSARAPAPTASAAAATAAAQAAAAAAAFGGGGSAASNPFASLAGLAGGFPSMPPGFPGQPYRKD